MFDSRKGKFSTVYGKNGKCSTINGGTKYSLKTANGIFVSVTIKRLYRQAYNLEYCRDNTKDLDNERWLDVSIIPKFADLKGLYKVSDMGRVKSYCGYDAIILKPKDNGRGYYKLDLSGKTVRVNRLVLMAFEPTEDETLEADHKNFDTHDNRLVNLQWLTKADNISRKCERRNKMIKEDSKERTMLNGLVHTT